MNSLKITHPKLQTTPKISGSNTFSFLAFFIQTKPINNIFCKEIIEIKKALPHIF